MEKIYTIPVNEAFDACRDDKSKGCPFCELRKKVENDEIELILGASMMEPDIRIQTNEQGFCNHHFSMMLKRKNRLGLALMLESHLAHVDKCADGLFSEKKLDKIEKSCYICSKIDYHLSRMLETAAYLFETDRDFREKVKQQPYFCLEHYNAFAKAGKEELKRGEAADLAKVIKKVNEEYLSKLQEDVSWFCKKFDYRYDAEPWGDAKDAPERAIAFLSGKHEE